MVREPALVVMVEYVHVIVDLREIIAMLQLALDRLYAVIVESVLREGRYVIVKMNSTEMTVQVS